MQSINSVVTSIYDPSENGFETPTPRKSVFGRPMELNKIARPKETKMARHKASPYAGNIITGSSKNDRRPSCVSIRTETPDRPPMQQNHTRNHIQGKVQHWREKTMRTPTNGHTNGNGRTHSRMSIASTTNGRIGAMSPPRLLTPFKPPSIVVDEMECDDTESVFSHRTHHIRPSVLEVGFYRKIIF